MRAGAIVAVLGVGALAAAGVAYAMRDPNEESGDDILDLPQPPETECTSAQDVWTSTNEILKDPAYKPDGLRKAADTLKEWGYYCDDTARAMGEACVAALEARATALENTPAGQEPTSIVDIPPSPIEIPGGSFYSGYGWCPPGASLDMATGLCSVNQIVIGQFPTLLGANVQTSGACCASCAEGHECESECGS